MEWQTSIAVATRAVPDESTTSALMDRLTDQGGVLAFTQVAELPVVSATFAVEAPDFSAAQAEGWRIFEQAVTAAGVEFAPPGNAVEAVREFSLRVYDFGADELD